MDTKLKPLPLKVAFHYHIPIYRDDDGALRAPGYFGTFIESLANFCEELYCLFFSALEEEKQLCDYSIANKKIIWIDLGPHHSIPKRYLRATTTIKHFRRVCKKVDILLVRTPTPFIPLISIITPIRKMAIYVVGDYNVSSMLEMNHPKKFFIQLLFKLMSFSEKQFARKNGLLITNSRNLAQDFKKISDNVYEIRSTSISKTDFYYRENTCQKKVVQLLYTGRLDPIKNIPTIFKAVKILNKEGINLHFNLAYLSDKYGLNHLAYLKQEAKKLKINDKVIFHGQKKKGEELNAIYRACDIYIIASSTEGFPRGIWDAMANGLPVIASTVGSIPFYLKDHQDALLIPPKDLNKIVKALREVIEDSALRKKMIKNGYVLAKDNTLETQGYKMIRTLNKYVKEVK